MTEGNLLELRNNWCSSEVSVSLFFKKNKNKIERDQFGISVIFICGLVMSVIVA